MQLNDGLNEWSNDLTCSMYDTQKKKFVTNTYEWKLTWIDEWKLTWINEWKLAWIETNLNLW